MAVKDGVFLHQSHSSCSFFQDESFLIFSLQEKKAGILCMLGGGVGKGNPGELKLAWIPQLGCCVLQSSLTLGFSGHNDQHP